MLKHPWAVCWPCATCFFPVDLQNPPLSWNNTYQGGATILNFTNERCYWLSRECPAGGSWDWNPDHLAPRPHCSQHMPQPGSPHLTLLSSSARQPVCLFPTGFHVLFYSWQLMQCLVLKPRSSTLRLCLQYFLHLYMYWFPCQRGSLSINESIN